MSKKLVSPELLGEIQRLRAERDSWGDPKWSFQEIGRKLGLSESTARRAWSGQMAYAGAGASSGRRETLGEEARWEGLIKGELAVPEARGLDAAARESEARLMAAMSVGSLPVPEEIEARKRRLLGG